MDPATVVLGIESAVALANSLRELYETMKAQGEVSQDELVALDKRVDDAHAKLQAALKG